MQLLGDDSESEALDCVGAREEGGTKKRLQRSDLERAIAGSVALEGHGVCRVGPEQTLHLFGGRKASCEGGEDGGVSVRVRID
jgi:hypothetical protein